MIITVNPNTGIDYTLIVPEFTFNRAIRASQVVYGMGGKATDAAWVLGELGIPNLALGFAAGANGERMIAMLQAKGVSTCFTQVNGETRLNIIVAKEDGSGHSTFTSATLKVLPEHIQAFLKEYEDALQDAAAVLIGGSLPAGVPLDFYPQIIRLAREKNLPVVFDASGEELRRGVEARPTVIKPNRDELKQLVPGDYSTTEAVYQAACSLRDRIGCSVVVTLGSEGALAVSKPASYWIPAIKVRTVSAAGAGDGVLAGITAALSRGEPFENGLRLGFAAATAVLLTPATADCRKADVERFYPEIRLIPYP